MNFLKNFVMEHPLISLITAICIANRVEDCIMVSRAMKNGTEYNGRRWRIGPSKDNEETVVENKEEN